MCAKPADHLGDELRHEGHRFTHQRQAIFEEMQKQKCHPDAREIYDIVRQRLPRISLGTVYRGLEVLVKLRLIRKVKHEDTSRFDANLSDHYHLICSCCNQISDVDTSVLTGLNTQGLEAKGFKVNGHKLELSGLCSNCTNLVRNFCTI